MLSALTYVGKHHANVKLGIKKSLCFNWNVNFPIIFLWENPNPNPYNVISGIWICSIIFPIANFFWQNQPIPFYHVFPAPNFLTVSIEQELMLSFQLQT